VSANVETEEGVVGSKGGAAFSLTTFVMPPALLDDDDKEI